MPELHMLIGLPGSGKSTFIKEFLAKNPEKEFIIISTDDIIEECCARDGVNYSIGFSKYIGFASKEMKRRANEAIKANKNIIWDQTNLTAKSRTSKMRQAQKHESHAIVFSIPDDELNRRLTERAKQTGKFIPENVIKDMARSYVPPSKDEGFKTITYIKK